MLVELTVLKSDSVELVGRLAEMFRDLRAIGVVLLLDLVAPGRGGGLPHACQVETDSGPDEQDHDGG